MAWHTLAAHKATHLQALSSKEIPMQAGLRGMCPHPQGWRAVQQRKIGFIASKVDGIPWWHSCRYRRHLCGQTCRPQVHQHMLIHPAQRRAYGLKIRHDHAQFSGEGAIAAVAPG